MPDAWNIATNTTTVNVGIIDSGIQGNHEDLTNVVNRTLSKDFTGGNAPLTDEHGHGTAVAGVVGAKANNSIGIAGTCGNVNKDGSITSADANLVRQYLANAVVLSPSQLYIADVNYSGSITIKDATNIEKYVIGELDYFID